MTSELALIVHGTPSPKGSLAYKGHTKKGVPVLQEQVRRSPQWRQRVVNNLVEYAQSHTLPTPKRDVPIGLEVTFTFPRPTSHYGTGRNHNTLKPSAPAYPTGHNLGDTDKLLRNILDAMQDAGIVADDAQVVEVTGRKTYPDSNDPDALPHPGALIRIYPITTGTG
jgi:Holliday junction resolvase RusA-like endonuclease